MIIQKKIITEKQKTRNQKKAERKRSKIASLEQWHLKWVIYRIFDDYETNTQTHVLCQTVERIGRFYPAKGLDSDSWSWKYRLPQNDNVNLNERSER